MNIALNTGRNGCTIQRLGDQFNVPCPTLLIKFKQITADSRLRRKTVLSLENNRTITQHVKFWPIRDYLKYSVASNM